MQLHATIIRSPSILAALTLGAAFLFSPATAHTEETEAPAITATIPGDALKPGDRVTISFPTEMIDTGRVWTDEANPPVEFDPPLGWTASWMGQTEMALIVNGLVKPGANYTLRLKRGVKDLAGEPVKKQEIASFGTVAFEVSSWFGESSKLSADPPVDVRFTYPVNVSNAIEGMYIQDRDSRERKPVEAAIYEESRSYDDEESGAPAAPSAAEANPLVQTRFRVKPASPLPSGRTWDLVIDRAVDANFKTPLPGIKVVPLGTTSVPEVEYVAAWNYAGGAPSILVKFTQYVDPTTVSSETIRVEPDVPNLKILPSGAEVSLEGDFTFPAKYVVHFTDKIKSVSGYSLAKPEKWGATFRERQPSVLFASDPQFLFRSALGLNFSFLQSNTGELTWRLARAPVEKLPAISKRLKEFLEEERDPTTGSSVDDGKGGSKLKTTKPLIDAFELKTVATGTIEASGAKEVRRELVWKPDAKSEQLSGSYLLEITGIGPDGKTYGNRAIVSFTDLYAVQKRSISTITMRIARMTDAEAVVGAEIVALTREGIELARERTGEDGLVSFPVAALFDSNNPLGQAAFFLIKGTDGVAFYQEAQPSQFSSGFAGRSADSKTLGAEYILDRPLYRPGETVKIKGVLRWMDNGELEIPTGKVTVVIQRGYEDERVAEFEAPITDTGGWDGEWVIPETAAVGNYRVRCFCVDKWSENSRFVQVEEYRPPLYSVVVETTDAELGEDAVKVSSNYFHGAPNAGATVRWKAEWYDTSDFGYETSYVDLHSDKPFHNAPLTEVTGEAKLDSKGFAKLVCASPFKDLSPRVRCQVTWTIDVISPEGQTLTAGISQMRQLQKAIIGINAEEEPGEGVKLTLSALDPEENEVPGVKADVDIVRAEFKTVREEIAPRVARYRNTRILQPVKTVSLSSGESTIVKVSEPGEYIALAHGQAGAKMLVSDKTTVSGTGDATFPVASETSFSLTQDTSTYTVGGTASIQVNSPFAGTAWVAVEAREILDTFTTKLDGNAGRIEIPIKREYAPNATISVHLTGPGGPDELPLERFSYTGITVNDPARDLKLEPRVALPVYEPRSLVEGTVLVTSEDRPVQNAEVLVYAVDDAILQLGSWSAPEIGPIFFPFRPFGVATYTAFTGLLASLKEQSLGQKGFVIGDGGAESAGNVLMIRSIFKPLAFWSANMRTNKEGLVKFNFETPDNLTTYRVCAAGQTKKNQFGFGHSTFKVSKPLIVEPALPRFLRNGDMIELRAVIRQDEADSQNIEVTCETEGTLALEKLEPVTVEAPRGSAAVARFNARVAESGTGATVRFVAKGAASNDAVEIKLPVVEPFILRHESQAGKFTDKDESLASLTHPDWQRGVGTFRGAASTSPWLPKLNGLPQIYEYPHGCFEQISSRLLVYAMLGDLLDYLPDSDGRRERLAEAATDGLKKYNASVLSDGSLPYWPGGETSSDFITAYAGWTLNELRKANVAVDEALFNKLRGALIEMAAGRRTVDAFSRCLALMVVSGPGVDKELTDAADALYRERDGLNDEARALLAVALHRMNHNEAAMNQLIAEISAKTVEREFDPKTFTSVARADAIGIFARAECRGKGWKDADRDAAEERLLETMDTAAMLSTQENLWSLLAFKSLIATKPPQKIKLGDTNGVPHSRSINGSAVGWLAGSAAGLDSMRKALTMAEGYYVLTGNFALPERNTQKVDRGFRVERIVKNLTEGTRDGSKEKPYKLGDTLLVTYRLVSNSRQYYVALEDALPAGIETVNPNISSVGEFFQLPETDDPMLGLSHDEVRDKVARLYFDQVEKGPGVAMTIARVTSAGEFIWPATSVTPMYDARVSGLSASSVVHAVGE